MAEIESTRTILRRFEKSDLKNLIELESDPDIMRFTGIGMALSEEKIIERLDNLLKKPQGALGVWAAELKSSGDFVGWFMLQKIDSENPELGFMLVKRHWGKGLATEIAEALIRYGFEVLGLKKIIATTNVDNVASMRVLEKIGMEFQKEISVPNVRLGKDIPLKSYHLMRQA